MEVEDLPVELSHHHISLEVLHAFVHYCSDHGPYIGPELLNDLKLSWGKASERPALCELHAGSVVVDAILRQK